MSGARPLPAPPRSSRGAVLWGIQTLVGPGNLRRQTIFRYQSKPHSFCLPLDDLLAQDVLGAPELVIDRGVRTATAAAISAVVLCSRKIEHGDPAVGFTQGAHHGFHFGSSGPGRSAVRWGPCKVNASGCSRGSGRASSPRASTRRTQLLFKWSLHLLAAHAPDRPCNTLGHRTGQWPKGRKEGILGQVPRRVMGVVNKLQANRVNQPPILLHPVR